MIPRRLRFPVVCILLTSIAGSTPGVADEPELAGQPVEVFRSRRVELIKVATAEAIKLAGPEGRPLVILAGAGVPELSSKARQDNDFSYLTGIEASHASLMLAPAVGGVDDVLFLPSRDPEAERWDGPQQGPGDETARSGGFSRAEPTSKLLADVFDRIGDPLTGSKKLGRIVVFTDLSEGLTGRRAALVRLLRDGAPSTRVVDVSPLIHELRRLKVPSEVALLRRAIAITGQAQAEIARTLRPGLFEYQVEARIVGAFLDGGASRAGFPSIVGSGPNSLVLHHMRNDRRMDDGELVVCDIGAEFRQYTADITRTYPVSGTFTPRQKAIYQLVLDAQADAASSFKPGVSTLDSLHKRAVEFFKESDLRGKDRAGVDQSMDAFFTHGLGHHLGMDVHDVGDRSKPLSAGSVFTIEPGLYIPSEGIGVRIEDDYLATETGLEKLSASIPSEPDAVEKAISEARSGR